MNKIIIKERGIAAHFCDWSKCHYRRNTLITHINESITTRVVVSSIGDYYIQEKLMKISPDKYFETKAFEAQKDGDYWVANTQKDISFDSPWGIDAEYKEDIPKGVYNIMDAQHDAVVREIVSRMLRNELEIRN